MKNKSLLGLLTVFGLLGSFPVFAHHGNAAYDYAATKTVKGIVTEWVWSNPHCLLKVDSKDDKGSVTHWVFETSSPVDMLRVGWTATVVKTGDEVSVDIMPTKNGTPVGRIRKVVLPDGTVLTATNRYTL